MMKINRSAFFAITGALSVACVVHEGPPPPAPPPPPVAAATPASTPAQPAAHPATPPPPPPPATHAATPPAPPAPPAPASAKKEVIVPIRPANCLGEEAAATVPTCTIACAANPAVGQKCAAYAVNFDPKIAAAAITCMNGLKAATGCNDMSSAYACGKSALAQACPDTNTVGQLCQIAATPCKISATDCVTMISGLNQKGQDAVASCVAKGCTNGLYSCVEGLNP